MFKAMESSLWYLVQPNALRELHASVLKAQKEGKDRLKKRERHEKTSKEVVQGYA
jgi:hypothetical protein